MRKKLQQLKQICMIPANRQVMAKFHYSVADLFTTGRTMVQIV